MSTTYGQVRLWPSGKSALTHPGLLLVQSGTKTDTLGLEPDCTAQTHTTDLQGTELVLFTHNIAIS